MIDTNGIITWTPEPEQVPSTNLFTTKVTDNGLPPLSATNSFTAFVTNTPAIVLNSTPLVAEGCPPANNAIDPGETVVVSFALQNTGGVPTPIWWPHYCQPMESSPPADRRAMAFWLPAAELSPGHSPLRRRVRAAARSLPRCNSRTGRLIAAVCQPCCRSASVRSSPRTSIPRPFPPCRQAGPPPPPTPSHPGSPPTRSPTRPRMPSIPPTPQTLASTSCFRHRLLCRQAKLA